MNNKKVLMIILIIIGIVILLGVILVLFKKPREVEIDTVVEVEKKETTHDVFRKDSDKPYVENQVLATADSKSEANKIAKAIGGELISYEEQVAIIQIPITVEEMMQMLEEDPSLPRVSPNYTNYQNYTF